MKLINYTLFLIPFLCTGSSFAFILQIANNSDAPATIQYVAITDNKRESKIKDITPHETENLGEVATPAYKESRIRTSAGNYDIVAKGPADPHIELVKNKHIMGKASLLPVLYKQQYGNWYALITIKPDGTASLEEKKAT